MPVQTNIENLYRKAHEAPASAVWALSSLSCVVAAVATGMPTPAAVALTSSSACMSMMRGWQAKRLFEAKLSLAGNQFWYLPIDEFEKILRKRPDHLWLGRGFRWTAQHTERAIELNRLNTEDLLPPAWFMKLTKRPHDQSQVKGEPWIHGLEKQEGELFMPWWHAEGNWNFFGTTGSGKTRLYEVLCSQIVPVGDTLIVVDPKGDKELKRLLRRLCELAGRPEAFAHFHPAFPSSSVRLDPLANFTRSTEIASRIVDVVGGDASDSFGAFIWRTINSITDGMLYVSERPSLKSLRYYAENGPEPLVEKALQKFLQGWRPNGWEDHVNVMAAMITNKKLQPRLKTGTPRQQAMVQFYHDEVPQADKLDELNGMVSLAEHSREHYGKMIAGLLPTLTQLTSGSLGELLSPNYEDITDKREILDMRKVSAGKRVLLLQTDSLSDSTVGAAIAAITMADLRADAGARYNFDEKAAKDAIHLLIDEAGEVVNRPLIAILNKGRGAGLKSYLATQNFSDYIAKFGSEEIARQVLGNTNNRLCLRVVDTKTQKYMVESFGEVNVKTASASTNVGTRAESIGLDYTGGMSTSVSERAAELFPSYLLGKLPDFHFVASVSGGKVFKGRIPKLEF
jgi:conjugal transfer pilus assembly protein TraD